MGRGIIYIMIYNILLGSLVSLNYIIVIIIIIIIIIEYLCGSTHAIQCLIIVLYRVIRHRPQLSRPYLRHIVTSHWVLRIS